MTPDERERLAELIARELVRQLATEQTTAEPATAPAASRRAPWLPIPVRPAPPVPSGAPPDWSAAAQLLGDVAPIREPRSSPHRDDAAAAAAAVRGAAAGTAARPHTSASDAASGTTRTARGRSALRTTPSSPGRRENPVGRTVDIGVSRRHLHVSARDARTLFGSESLDILRTIRQPGQFAAVQLVNVEGPAGRIDGVRVVGPLRAETQLELARSDARRLGIEVHVAASGALQLSVGGVTLIGAAGRLPLTRGVIIAARHLHCAPDDAARWGMTDGDVVDLRCGEGPCAVTWHNVLVRAGAAHTTECHLDGDEADAAAITHGATATIVAHRPGGHGRRRLVTERELRDLVRRGEPLPAHALYTPSARDRARALGIVLP